MKKAFSNKVKEFSTIDLTKLLLQELGHHILPTELATDEEVVNQLAIDFLGNGFDEALDDYISIELK